MTDAHHKEHFNAVQQAVQRAAELCRTVQAQDVAAVEKPGREPVTVADFGSQAVICHAIQQTFPDDAVLAEEQGVHFQEKLSEDQRRRVVSLVGEVLGETVTADDIAAWLDHGKDREAEYTWVIDPIDGTKGFLAQRSYTIAVGLLQGHTPVASVMGSPGYPDSAGRLFAAIEGKAYTRQLNEATLTPIQVSERKADTSFCVVESVESQHAAHDIMAQAYGKAGIVAPMVKRVDGQDKYAMIAMGDADLYLRVSPQTGYREKVWDHAAGVALIEAAGGKVTDMYGKPLDFSAGSVLESNTFVVVSNGREHDNVIQALKTLYAAL